MFFYEGLSCPHCHHTFKDTDDIVSCPVCGAPHHRGCWSDAGGCACAKDHGTENEWSRDKAAAKQSDTPHAAKRCPHCGGDNAAFAEFCARCGRELPAEDWHSDNTASRDDPYAVPPPAYHEYAPFHVQSPYGGVAPDTVIEGESARDVAAIVATNTPYYMPRFDKMSRKKSKVSWNWAAFLLTEYWLFHRKQYVLGALVMAFNLMLDALTLGIMQALILTPFINTLTAFNGTVSYPQLSAWVLNTPSVQPTVMLLGLFMLTMFLVKLFFGLFGNAIYLQSCVKTIRRTRNSYPEGYQAQLPVYGGTSFVLAIVMYMCANILMNLLSTLFYTL